MGRRSRGTAEPPFGSRQARLRWMTVGHAPAPSTARASSMGSGHLLMCPTCHPSAPGARRALMRRNVARSDSAVSRRGSAKRGRASIGSPHWPSMIPRDGACHKPCHAAFCARSAASVPERGRQVPPGGRSAGSGAKHRAAARPWPTGRCTTGASGRASRRHARAPALPPPPAPPPQAHRRGRGRTSDRNCGGDLTAPSHPPSSPLLLAPVRIPLRVPPASLAPLAPLPPMGQRLMCMGPSSSDCGGSNLACPSRHADSWCKTAHGKRSGLRCLNVRSH